MLPKYAIGCGKIVGVIDTKNNYGYTPPCIAKEWGHLSTVKLLHGTKPY
jgi:hypothetical protein